MNHLHVFVGSTGGNCWGCRSGSMVAAPCCRLRAPHPVVAVGLEHVGGQLCHRAHVSCFLEYSMRCSSWASSVIWCCSRDNLHGHSIGMCGCCLCNTCLCLGDFPCHFRFGCKETCKETKNKLESECNNRKRVPCVLQRDVIVGQVDTSRK